MDVQGTTRSVWNMTLPPQGPIAIPITVPGDTDAQWTFDDDGTNTIGSLNLDFTQIVNAGQLDFVSGVYFGVPFDTIDVGAGWTFSLYVPSTMQRLYFPRQSVGFLPLLAQNPPIITVNAEIETASLDAFSAFNLIFYNFPQFPFLWSPIND